MYKTFDGIYDRSIITVIKKENIVQNLLQEYRSTNKFMEESMHGNIIIRTPMKT